jgi:hypothetical protein
MDRVYLGKLAIVLIIKPNCVKKSKISKNLFTLA